MHVSIRLMSKTRLCARWALTSRPHNLQADQRTEPLQFALDALQQFIKRGAVHLRIDVAGKANAESCAGL